MWAIFDNHQKIAMELIEAGADLNIVDNCGNAALIQAVKNGDQLISEMLFVRVPTKNQSILREKPQWTMQLKKDSVKLCGFSIEFSTQNLNLTKNLFLN